MEKTRNNILAMLYYQYNPQGGAGVRMAIALLSKRNKEINKVVLLPLVEIAANPHQPRKYFDPEGLQELARSIIANGLLQPITVRRREEGGYELVAGERRTMAFRSLGRETIPAIIEEYSSQQSAVLALIENLQRKDLNYFEEAAGIQRLMEEQDMTQQQISVRLGKAQSTVANKLRLLRYPPETRTKMLESGLSERHARAMLRISNQEQLEKALDHIIVNALNVEETEQYIDKLLQNKEQKKPTRLFVVKDMRMFRNSINKACSLMQLAGIPVDQKVMETEEKIEYCITIPKSAVYVDKRPKAGDAPTKMGVV